MGSQRDETEEPTANQLAALHKRVFIENRPPYCDFSVLGAPGEKEEQDSKVQGIHPFRGQERFCRRTCRVPAHIQPGKASWHVFRTACLMLNICSIAGLEAYSRQIEKLMVQWPKTWGLIYTADDSARAERGWRSCVEDSPSMQGQGRQVPRDWDPIRPWSCIFIHLAADTDYWTERVHHPAAAWTAAGGRGAPTVASEAAVLDVIQGGHKAMQADQDATVDTVATPDGRRTQANRDKRQARKRKLQADREELARHRSSGTSQSKGAPSNKGKGKGKSKDQSGQEICFSWASNKGSCADIPPGGERKAVVKASA